MGKNDFQYRHFLYLDSSEVLSVAAVIEGGEVTEELHTLVKELGGNIGIKFALASLGVGLGARGGRRFHKEVKLRRTVYVQARRVLNALPDNDISGSFEKTPLRISENDVVRCYIDPQSDSDLNKRIGDLTGRDPVAGWPLVRSWRQRAFRRDPANRAAKKRVSVLGQRFFAEFTISGTSNNTLTENSVLVLLDPLWMLDLPWFSRHATIIGQVIGVRRSDEQLIILDNGSDARFETTDGQQVSIEKGPHRDIAEGSPSASLTSDLSTSDGQAAPINKKPCKASVVLRPIVIFR
jgi:hypothetical protein